MKKDILKDLLAKPGKKHLVSDFDSSFTGDLSKQDAKEQLAKDIEKLSIFNPDYLSGDGCCRKRRDYQACDVRH